jgi:hypothetical protein
MSTKGQEETFLGNENAFYIGGILLYVNYASMNLEKVK